MGVKIQKPGELGHPGGNRRTYVRVNYLNHRKTRVFNSTKAAERYAFEVEYLLSNGKVEGVFTDPAPPPAAPMPTFKEAAERWLAVDGATLKAATLDTYQNILAKYLQPTFGPRPVTSISRGDVEGWWAGVLGRGLSRQRLVHIRSVISGIFRRAVSSGLVPSNPVEVIGGRLGREDREVRQAEWLTEPELTTFLARTREREPGSYPILLTLASTGIRLG